MYYRPDIYQLYALCPMVCTWEALNNFNVAPSTVSNTAHI